MNSYIIKCTGYETDENGEVTLIRCTADLETGSNMPSDGRKIKGTIHWVSATNCVDAQIVKYDKLFTEENLVTMEEGKTYGDYLNTDSVVRFDNAKLEMALGEAQPLDKFQFVRTGYFCRDNKATDKLVFNSIVELRDSKGK
jgi:glutaminyl-tRNA synthetase